MKIGFYNENTAKNAPYVEVNGVTFYLSYETVVAVSYGLGLKVIKNQWGPTTGKHLNWISTDHSIRLDPADFEKEEVKAMEKAGIDSLPSFDISTSYY
tara:strand:- start:2358 stop:2651 length:294 start_codon:yes stop_codon:yes gene_type:complete